MRAIGLSSDRERDHRCQRAILAPRQRHSAKERDNRRAWRGSGWSPMTPLARNSSTTALGETAGGTLSDAGAVPAGSTGALPSRVLELIQKPRWRGPLPFGGQTRRPGEGLRRLRVARKPTAWNEDLVRATARRRGEQRRMGRRGPGGGGAFGAPRDASRTVRAPPHARRRGADARRPGLSRRGAMPPPSRAVAAACSAPVPRPAPEPTRGIAWPAGRRPVPPAPRSTRGGLR